MATKTKFQAIKGTRDLLPPETELWNRVEQTAREVFSTYGFGEIRPPIFEPTELFARAVGGETDIVSKEMYTFLDRPEGAESLATRRSPLDSSLVSLRPEATASVCRAYIEHNMQQLPAPVKLYYLGPMFRRERPQKGRYRQFNQIGAEILGGTDAPGIDAEVIEMVMSFFARLGLEGVQLDINSIGHSAPECRRGYVEKLRAALVEVRDQLGEDSKRRIDTNPLRVLDSKLESEQAIIAKLPRISDHLCDECSKHYAEVKRQLDLRGVPFKENWRLVRGLDYYMRTTFEITAKGLGSQNAVCGGGRYDGLVELLGGPSTKGIGFAIGEDRLILSLQEAGKGSVTKRRGVYIAWMGEKAQPTAIAAARKLREAGFRVELPPTEQKFGKALGQADKLGSRYALILGEDEVASGQWTLKTLADGTQAKFSQAELLEFLRHTRVVSS
jgi:histidyl-tRNA synthetase